MHHHIYNLALVVHIMGISIMAGATFIDFRTFRQFWTVYAADKAKGLVVEDTLGKLQRFMGIGMLVILISGFLMMVYLHNVWGQQLWFQIKMGVLLLIIINGLAVRRKLGSNLKKILENKTLTDPEKRLSDLKGRISIVHFLQLLFFTIIFILSVFKFN